MKTVRVACGLDFRCRNKRNRSKKPTGSFMEIRNESGSVRCYRMATAMCANMGKVTKSGVRYLRRVGSISPRTSSRSAARAGDSSWVKAGTAAAELVTASGTKRSGA